MLCVQDPYGSVTRDAEFILKLWREERLSQYGVRQRNEQEEGKEQEVSRSGTGGSSGRREERECVRKEGGQGGGGGVRREECCDRGKKKVDKFNCCSVM